MTTSPWTTFKFKEVQGVSFEMDVYLPSVDQLRKSGRKRAPALLYYHGASLSRSRSSMYPSRRG